MRGGMGLALLLCAASICAGATDAYGAEEAADSLTTTPPQDTVFSHPVVDTLGEEEQGGISIPRGVLWPGVSPRRTQGRTAELATYKSLWEMLAASPQIRWMGSGCLGGLESISIQGSAMRRTGALADGLCEGPDFNMFAPTGVDSVRMVSGMSQVEEVALDGAPAVEVFGWTRAGERQEGYLSLSRGFFMSRFSSFSFTRSERSYWFGLKLDGASFGRAASYEAYNRDGGLLGGSYLTGSGLKMGIRARKFRSRAIRYTGDKTKSAVESVMLSAGLRSDDRFSWRLRTYYGADEYEYFENGPDVEDDLWSLGTAVELWPWGVDGAHRVSVGVRRENLERSVGAYIVPEDLVDLGAPDEGSRRSVNASAVYSLRLWKTEKNYARAAIRMDHKEMFGWEPSGYLQMGKTLGTAGEVSVSGGRTAYMPSFVDIYAPRDETARPTWFFASDMEPETQWIVSALWRAGAGGWTASAGAFASTKDHVLAPPVDWLGFNRGQAPVVASPLADLGDGSSVGAWAAAGRSWKGWVGADVSYSALRSRAGGKAVPFTPDHKVGLSVWAEREYFRGDMKVGIVLRGAAYSSQETPLDFDLPSYGLADALGYVSLSDVVFFYQLKNLETTPRPSAVLDAAAGEYFLQPEPEVRLGLVWYLPG